MKSYQQFFAELKRRKVFKVAAVYGAASFVLLQVADLLGQGLRLGDTFLPFITAIVLLGFPLALILAWAFEVTPEGVQRTGAAAAGEIEGIMHAPASQRWPAGLMALAGVAALVAGAWWVGTQTGPVASEMASGPQQSDIRLAFADLAEHTRPSIAVLPFVNMSADEDQEYFSDGITEEILNVLAKLPELRVAARTSAFAFRGQNLDMRAIGDSLDVDYLIEGSVRKAGDQLRITAQLIDVADGSHLWSESYDRTLDNVFQIQSEIAESVAEELKIPLGIDDPAGLVTPTADLEAYDLYLAGRARMRERGESLQEAIRLFEAAIARDSAWAPAWAGLAEVTEIHLWYTSPDGSRTRGDSSFVATALDAAGNAARRALELDPRTASAHVALGNVLRDRFQWRESEASYRKALTLDPDHAEAHQQYAELLLATGRTMDAVRSAGRAAALDPAPVKYNILAFTLWADGRSEQAVRAFQKGISLDPDMNLKALRSNLGLLHYDEGRYDEAYAVLATVPEIRADIDVYWEEWVSVLRQGTLDAFPDSARKQLSPDDMLHLGEPDRAANRLSHPRIDWISNLYRVWGPVFDPVRGHPAVQEYLKNKGLAGVTVQRTPVDEREAPAVLKKRETGATP